VGERLEVVQILLGACPLLEHLYSLEQFAVAHPAGSALTAGFVDEELHKVVGQGKHVSGWADDDHRPAGGDVFKGQPALEVLARHATP
jgi:hypothetical protein